MRLMGKGNSFTHFVYLKHTFIVIKLQIEPNLSTIQK